MKNLLKFLTLLMVVSTILWGCQKEEFLPEANSSDELSITMRERPGGGETAGNNLSFPVIWAEGGGTVPYGYANPDPLNGEWWYYWQLSETERDVCFPSPADETTCIDGEYPGSNWVKAYIQKDPQNKWQASSIDASEGEEVAIDWVDWGDNLESVNWNTRSKVRTEVVLYKENDQVDPWVEYAMYHVSGLGTDEVHGLGVDQDGNYIYGPGDEATVFSYCARLLIQKIANPDGTFTWEEKDGEYQWVSEVEGDIKDPIFNDAVYTINDGPQYYSAEINVKGKVIYGYTWDVRRLHDDVPGGYYRITFVLDEDCGTYSRHATLSSAQIRLSAETEGIAGEDGGDTGGGVAVIDGGNELTYIDVFIEDGKGNGGGGNGNSGGKGGGTPGGGKGGGNSTGGNGNSGNGSSGNTDTGTGHSGNTNSGNTNSGSTDTDTGHSGNTHSGNTNSGNTNSGSTDTGTGHSGNTHSGNTNSGTTNSGNTNSGNTNSGNTNSGNTNTGTTNNGNTSSGTIYIGTTNNGNTTGGNTNNGNTTGGNTNTGTSGTTTGWNPNTGTSGTTTSGNTNSGNTNTGTTTSGNTNSGNTNTGTTTSGNTNSGNTNTGTTTSGNTNSGNTNTGTTNSWNTNNGTSGTTNNGNTNTGTIGSGSFGLGNTSKSTTSTDTTKTVIIGTTVKIDKSKNN